MQIEDILNEEPQHEKRQKTSFTKLATSLPPLSSFVVPSYQNLVDANIVSSYNATFTRSHVPPKELVTQSQENSDLTSTQTRQVDMYYDLNCSNAIQPCSQINKDIIICFILLGVSKGTKGTRLPVDDSVLYLGKRKNYQNSSVSETALYAQLLVFENRTPVQLCGTCLKSSSQILKIRSAITDNNNSVKVAASVTCSGSPPASNKKLIVEFSIKDTNGTILWKADSPPFTLLHHRSKRNNTEKNEAAIQIYSQLGETMPMLQERAPLIQFNFPRFFSDVQLEMLRMVELCLTNMWSVTASTHQKLKCALSEDVLFLFSVHKFVGIDKLLALGKTLAVSLDDFETKIDDVCFTGNLIEGKVATKGYNRGKWVRPVGNYEPTGDIVTFPAFTFWTIRDYKIVSIESLIDNGQVPKWQLAWNNVHA